MTAMSTRYADRNVTDLRSLARALVNEADLDGPTAADYRRRINAARRAEVLAILDDLDALKDEPDPDAELEDDDSDAPTTLDHVADALRDAAGVEHADDIDPTDYPHLASTDDLRVTAEALIDSLTRRGVDMTDGYANAARYGTRVMVVGLVAGVSDHHDDPTRDRRDRLAGLLDTFADTGDHRITRLRRLAAIAADAEVDAIIGGLLVDGRETALATVETYTRTALRRFARNIARTLGGSLAAANRAGKVDLVVAVEHYLDGRYLDLVEHGLADDDIAADAPVPA